MHVYSDCLTETRSFWMWRSIWLNRNIDSRFSSIKKKVFFFLDTYQVYKEDPQIFQVKLYWLV